MVPLARYEDRTGEVRRPERSRLIRSYEGAARQVRKGQLLETSPLNAGSSHDGRMRRTLTGPLLIRADCLYVDIVGNRLTVGSRC